MSPAWHNERWRKAVTLSSASDLETLGLESAWEAVGFRALWSCPSAWPPAYLSRQCPECHPCPFSCYKIRWSLRSGRMWILNVPLVESGNTYWTCKADMLLFSLNINSCVRYVQPKSGRVIWRDPIEAFEVLYRKDHRALLVVWLWITF